MDINHKSYTNLYFNASVQNARGFGYDSVHGNTYIADKAGHAIVQILARGGARSSKVIKQLGTVGLPAGIAVDPVGQLIFFTDQGTPQIGVVTPDGNMTGIIITSQLQEPTAIAVNPRDGILFWTDLGGSTRIERSQYNGANRTVLVSTGLVLPYSLTIDLHSNKLYWADAGTGKIESCNFDGSGRNTVLTIAGSDIRGLAFADPFIYYTDNSRSTIMRVNKDGSGNTAFGPPGFNRNLDIHYFKRGTGFSGPTACTNNNGGCAQFCFPQSGNKRVCGCRTGQYIMPGGVKCGTQKPCHALLAPQHGTISPAVCTSGSSYSGTTCTVSCDPGLICATSHDDVLRHGTWSHYSNNLACRNTLPPDLHCPANVTKTTPVGSEMAVISWPSPTVNHPSGHVIISQSIHPPAKFAEGVTTISVTARDSSSLISTCTFSVNIKVRRCPALNPPTNGYLTTVPCPNYQGAQCGLACNTGFGLQLPGQIPVVTCIANTANAPVWSATPNCTAVSCDAVPAPSAGTVYPSSCSSGRQAAGTVCNITCNTGTSLVGGSPRIVCRTSFMNGQPTGLWSGATSVKCLTKSQQDKLGQDNGDNPPNGTAIAVGVVLGILALALVVVGGIMYYRRLQMQAGSRSGRGFNVQSRGNGLTNPMFESTS
ncbi:hypothetical protein ScPMuIL_011591 [Solemya velum]